MPSTRNPGRFAGLLYLLTSLVGVFGMGYVPGKLIDFSNAAATVSNIAAHETLFRFGIAAQLIGMAGFIFVAMALYHLLEAVNRRQAVLMIILIVVSVPIAFVNELNSVAVLLLAPGASLVAVPGPDFLSAIAGPQREALAMLFLNLHHYGLLFAEVFWGLWLFPLALLVYRSRFIPRFLGAWLALAGVAWVVISLTGILLPEYLSKVNAYSQPAVIGEIAFMLWLVIRGARPPAPQ